MSKKITLFFASFFLLTNTLFASIKSGADALIDKVSPNTNIGVEVVDLITGSTLYTRNAARSFIPASNMKLFSDAAALMVLGPDYRFKNQLSTDASELQQGTLKGSLYLHLPGDPSFSHKNLRFLLMSLKKWGITRIDGDIVVASTHTNINPYAPGWSPSDFVYSYGAPLAPVMVDANRVSVVVNPAHTAGLPAVVEILDPSHSLTLQNTVHTKAEVKGCGVGFAMDANNHVKVQGCVKKGQWAVQQDMAIRGPFLYLQDLIKHQLSQMHIHLNGQIRLGNAPKNTLLIATESSKPISQLMADTLKPSDNLYADSLFLHAAARLQGYPVNWQAAQTLIKNFLTKQTGIDLSNAILIDGSGLSRNNRITPHQTTSLLRYLNERFPLSYEYIAALPVSGRDGTLQKRFKTPAQQDLVRAKTGTMTGIHSLSGYLYTANGHTLAFALYANKSPGTSSGKHRYLIDALCNYFLKQQPSNIGWAQVFSPHGRLQFQQNPTQADLQRRKKASWRRLETVIKQALLNKPVTVIFRGNELVLEDKQASPYAVWTSLQNLRKKYPFAIALASQTALSIKDKAQLLWIPRTEDKSARTWTIKEAI